MKSTEYVFFSVEQVRPSDFHLFLTSQMNILHSRVCSNTKGRKCNATHIIITKQSERREIVSGCERERSHCICFCCYSCRCCCWAYQQKAQWAFVKSCVVVLRWVVVHRHRSDGIRICVGSLLLTLFTSLLQGIFNSVSLKYKVRKEKNEVNVMFWKIQHIQSNGMLISVCL